MSKLLKHVITESNYVECQICKKKMEKIDNRHLKIHNVAFEEYLSKYPNSPTITKSKYDQELVNIEKRKKGKRKVNKKSKIAKCIYCEKLVEVNVNVPDSFVVCQNCLYNGKEKPMSKRMKEITIPKVKEKYGVNNISQHKEVKNQKRETIEKNKSKDPNYLNKINEKRDRTKKERFGENYNQTINKLQQKGMEKKYGKRHALQIQEFKEKSKNTYLKKTGYLHPSQNPIDNAKRVNSLLNNYGVDVPAKSHRIQEKIRKSNIEKFGVPYPTMDKEVIRKREKSNFPKFKEKFQKILDYLDLELLEEYRSSHEKVRLKCKKCGNEFIQRPNAIQQGYTCEICFPRNFHQTSKGENEVKEFIESLGFDINQSNRSIISPYEIDLLLYDQKIGIEYCGLFWHSEEEISKRKTIKTPRLFHREKLNRCFSQGYKLIQIFEDEWIFKPNIVKSRLKQILNVKDSEKIYARNCKIYEISPEEKDMFLNSFHLQGSDKSTIKLGAFYNDTLISVMTFSKPNISKGIKLDYSMVYELNRFCTNYNYHIPGIAGKLLEHFKRNYDWDEIFTYADRRWSNGNLYFKLGFNFIKETPPNYFYFNPNKIPERIHRFNLRKRKGEPKDIPEKILRKKEGYYTIWDCGHMKFKIEKE